MANLHVTASSPFNDSFLARASLLLCALVSTGSMYPSSFGSSSCASYSSDPIGRVEATSRSWLPYVVPWYGQCSRLCAVMWVEDELNDSLDGERTTAAWVPAYPLTFGYLDLSEFGRPLLHLREVRSRLRLWHESQRGEGVLVVALFEAVSLFSLLFLFLRLGSASPSVSSRPHETVLEALCGLREPLPHHTHRRYFASPTKTTRARCKTNPEKPLTVCFFQTHLES